MAALSFLNTGTLISYRKKTEEDLIRSEQLYRSILAASPDGITITDLEGRIRMVSPTARTMFGINSKENLTGKDNLDFLVAEDRDRARTNIALMFQGVFTGPGEYRGVRSDGSIIDIESNAEFIKDSAGSPTGLVMIIRDIGECKRAEAQQRRHAAIQLVQSKIAEAALVAATLNDFYADVHKWVGHVLPTKNFYIALLDESTHQIVRPYCVDQMNIVSRQRPVGNGLTEYVMRLGKVFHASQTELASLRQSGEVSQQVAPVHEYLGAPLKDSTGKSFGVIALNSVGDDPPIREEDLDVLSIIATQVSLEIDRKQLEEKLKLQATTDELTGLFNRRAVSDKIQAEFEGFQRSGSQFSLVIADIDFFKHVNDLHGHNAGDFLLRSVAHELAQAVRDCDTISRWGGEEFLCLLPSTDIKMALSIAERMRSSIFEKTFSWDDNQLSITLTFGVAAVNERDTVDSLIHRADQALYWGKKTGRNRVVNGNDLDAISIPPERVTWNTTWESGNKTIDEQHRKLLELVTHLLDLSILQAPDSQISSQLDRLLEHVVGHFSTEEEIMANIGYAETKAHAEIHANLTTDALMLRETFLKGDLKPVAFFEFLVGKVLMGHLLTEDVKFFPLTRQ